MRILNNTLVKILTRNNIATEETLKPLMEEAERSSRPLQDIVLDSKLVSETDLTKLFAQYADIPYIEVDPRNIPSEVLNRIPERIARQYNAVVFQIDEDGTMHLAMDDPDDVLATNFIEKEIGSNTKIYIAPHSNILQCLENYRGDVNQELNEVIDVQREDDGSDQKVSEADVAEDSPIAQTVNLLLEYAIRSQASDIHIEPRENFVQVRYRIDGVLKEVNQLPRNVLNALVSRIKILSNLKIDERRVPQDGRFKIKVAGKQYALRVSTLPITDGEKVVMRILDESNQAITLQQLGYWGRSLAIINNAIAEPNGMILVTGPTGSGKSTSLFSVLSMLNTPEVNISTIEDPVEYKIPGVNQTQTNAKAGMTFASGLRALLRQHHGRRDPRRRDSQPRRTGGSDWALGIFNLAHQQCGDLSTTFIGYGYRAILNRFNSQGGRWAALSTTTVHELSRTIRTDARRNQRNSLAVQSASRPNVCTYS